MSSIDTHAHLYLKEFHADFDAVVSRAQNAGVEKVLLPNINEETIDAMKTCLSRIPAFFSPMMGLHPTSVTKMWRDQLSIIHEELVQGGYIAVGEVGIDLHWDKSLEKEQVQAFEAQLEWSKTYNLPLSIHFRNATKQVVDSVRRVGENSLRGVFHSFGGDREELEMILSFKNFLVGVNGVLTYKNSGLADTLIHCPRDRLIVETDAPYLSPVPYRGKRNESSYLPFILHKLSEVWTINPKQVAAITRRNASALFALKE